MMLILPQAAAFLTITDETQAVLEIEREEKS